MARNPLRARACGTRPPSPVRRRSTGCRPFAAAFESPPRGAGRTPGEQSGVPTGGAVHDPEGTRLGRGRPSSPNAPSRAWWVLWALGLAGCGPAPIEGRLAVFPTRGAVTVAGQPAAGARVVLYGATAELQGPGTVAPAGVADAEGRFELGSYELSDGAPAGKFLVSVCWPEAIPPGVDAEMFQPKDRLQRKYLDPQKSGLTVEIPPGGGELPPLQL